MIVAMELLVSFMAAEFSINLVSHMYDILMSDDIIFWQIVLDSTLIDFCEKPLNVKGLVKAAKNLSRRIKPALESKSDNEANLKG